MLKVFNFLRLFEKYNKGKQMPKKKEIVYG